MWPCAAKASPTRYVGAIQPERSTRYSITITPRAGFEDEDEHEHERRTPNAKRLVRAARRSAEETTRQI